MLIIWYLFINNNLNFVKTFASIYKSFIAIKFKKKCIILYFADVVNQEYLVHA